MKARAFVMVAGFAVGGFVVEHIAYADDPPAEAGSNVVTSGSDAAQPPAASGSNAAPAENADDAEPAPTPAELAEHIEEQDRRIQQLEREARTNQSFQKDVSKMRWLSSFISVFVDVGAFAVGGDGSGIRSDLGHLYYPKYAGQVAGQWVFMGDVLSTAINSLGEPADTSDSRAEKDDTIHSGGRPSLIVNSIGLSVGKYVGHGVSVVSLTELLPRPGRNILDIELARIDYRPLPTTNLVISAGKVDSVLGVEYRSQDAPKRLGISPSLIGRYTSGRPLGVEARLTEGRLSASGGVFASSQFDDRFEPKLELHGTDLPTVAGHLQWIVPVGQRLEIGVSGAVGPQDNQPSTSIAQWHLGFDLQLTDLDGWDMAAEYVQGLQQGQTMALPCDVAACLTYKGAYVLVDHRVTEGFTPYFRLDWRDAVHTHGADFVYESHVARATIGVHLEMSSRILMKVEYTFNHEVDGIPQFADDILTSSLVVATD